MKNTYEKSSKSSKRVSARDFLECFLALAVIFIIRVGLSKLCVKTNSPLVIMIEIINASGLVCILQFWILIFLFNLKPLDIDIKSVIRDRFFKISAVVVIVIFLLLSLLPMSKRYGNIRVNDKNTSRLKYCCLLFSDTVNNNTDSVKMNSENLGMELYSYTISSRGSSSTFKERYFSFEGYSTLLYENRAEKYVRTCQKFGKDIELEYYKKSGIIKTIDGIDLYDESGFDKAVSDLEKAEAEKQEEEKKIEEQEREKANALFSAFYHSEGQNYNAIMDALKKDNIDYTYNTVYISTKYFEPGEVAFFDNQDDIVYVVRDNDAEEMKVVPLFPPDGTLSEITKIFDENGIKWTFYCSEGFWSGKDDLDHSHDTFKTIHSVPGTPIPEDYVLWFSVDHVGEIE